MHIVLGIPNYFYCNTYSKELFYHELVTICMWVFLDVVSWRLRPVAAAFVSSVDASTPGAATT